MTVHQPTSSASALFVSYAREDRESVRTLVEGIEQLRYTVWMDQKLTIGQAWWNEILTQIRTCDALLVAVSPSLFESPASALERQYGTALGKPLLPVVIRTVTTLPPDLAAIHFVDYTAPGPTSGFELAGALAALPAPPPLPELLPAPPKAPVTHLADLNARVHAPDLGLEEQLTVVARLRPSLQKASERDAALELLKALWERDDLYRATARDIEPLLAHAPNTSASADEGPQSTPRQRDVERPPRATAGAPPGGWYPDPSGRHALRWFDGEWTSWASDNGDVIDSPLM